MNGATGILVAAIAAVALCTCLACGGGNADPESVAGMERIRYEELSVLAEARLECPRERLEYTYLGDKVHLLEGCGKQIHYMIFEHGEVWVKVESFHERAAFDLECDVARLSSTREAGGTWRVTGCDKQTRYTLSCGDDGVTCTWIAGD